MFPAAGSMPRSRSASFRHTSSVGPWHLSSAPSRRGLRRGGSATGQHLVLTGIGLLEFQATCRRCKLASVVKRRRKDGSYGWYARYRDGRGKDVWERCSSAKAAKARAAEVEVELARSGGMWSPAAKVTVAEYAERWLTEHGSTLRARTLANYRRIFERDLIPEFGHTPLAALSRAKIKSYAARRAAGGAKANTVRNSIAPLRAMLSSALEDGLVRENVALRLPRVGAAAGEDRGADPRAGRRRDRRRRRHGRARPDRPRRHLRPAPRRGVRAALGRHRLRQPADPRARLQHRPRHHPPQDRRRRPAGADVRQPAQAPPRRTSRNPVTRARRTSSSRPTAAHPATPTGG